MADMHVIDGDGQSSWKVVMHFDIPDIDNDVSVNYRTALANSGIVDSVSPSVLPDGDGTVGSISAAEKTDLTDGVKYEHVVSINLDGTGTTNASRIANLKSVYASTETQVINSLKRRLKLFGHNQARA